ncbi:MAG: membrane protein insertase YidC [Cytophagaceae bacterium]
MDRNQITGYILILLIFITYFIFFGNQERPERPMADTTAVAHQPSVTVVPDSVKEAQLKATYGDLSTIATGEAKDITIENDELRVTFSTQGGMPKRVLLKNYLADNKDSLYLINDNNSEISIKAALSTGEADIAKLFYNSDVTKAGDTTIVIFTANAGENKTITHTYKLPPSGFLLDYNLQFSGLTNTLSSNPVIFDWKANIPKVEYDLKQSRLNTAVNYFSVEDGFSHIKESETGSESVTISSPLKWISMKTKFFNAGFIAENQFLSGFAKGEVLPDEQSVKLLQASVAIPSADLLNNAGNFKFYFGPNHYQTLRKVPAEDYDKNVYLGWPVINLINRFIVIPVFNFLESFIPNYGVIIIILVILLKLILFPLSYKSYISMAKMKVLKPELDEIKEKYGDDMQKVQAEQMSLYSKVGINPLSGCIPMLLQMPILLAMFNFFPNSIELRQESFLWAHDLSTYDAVFTWDTFIWGLSNTYGNHFSLFTFLMTLSTLATTWVNNQVSTVTGPMKSVSYVMPVVFMFVLNSFPAGLSFYYLMSNIVTIIQQYVIRRFVDEDKIKAILDENRKKIAAGQGKKSKWMQRVEDAMKANEEIKKKQQQQGKKKK